MRQVGVLAAPGLIALRDGSAGMIDRLAEDHANARFLAEALAELDGIAVARATSRSRRAGRLDPGRVAHELRASSGSSATAPRSSTRSRAAASSWSVHARTARSGP